MTQENKTNIVCAGIDFSPTRNEHRFDILGAAGGVVGTLVIALPATGLEDLRPQVLQAHAAVADVLRDLAATIESRAAALAGTPEA